MFHVRKRADRNVTYLTKNEYIEIQSKRSDTLWQAAASQGHHAFSTESTQEGKITSRRDWKIVDCDITNKQTNTLNSLLFANHKNWVSFDVGSVRQRADICNNLAPSANFW